MRGSNPWCGGCTLPPAVRATTKPKANREADRAARHGRAAAQEPGRARAPEVSRRFTTGEDYPEASLCTHQGSLWLSVTEMPTGTPGEGIQANERLIVKRGQAA